MPDSGKTATPWLLALTVFACIPMVFGSPSAAQVSGEPADPKQESAKRPRPSDEPEIDRLRIQWHINRSFDAYTEALAESKPTLLFFTARPCGFCLTQLQRFRCPEIVRYAGFMKFSVSWREEDEGGDHLAGALNVQRFPTVAILKTDMDKLHVIGRIEGVFPADDIDRVIQEAFRSYADDEKTQMPDLLGVAETRRMLDQVGIAQPSEAFCAGEDG